MLGFFACFDDCKFREKQEYHGGVPATLENKGFSYTKWCYSHGSWINKACRGLEMM